MKFTGLHHITMITGDAQLNARYYGDLLGLRLVKKTVNFDQPQAYHLYFGDETGAPGSILTWFEFPQAARGRAGAGAIHTLQLAVADEAALDFWEQRLDDTERAPGVLRFADYDGLHARARRLRPRQRAAARGPSGDPGRARDQRAARRPRLRQLRRPGGHASSRTSSASPTRARASTCSRAPTASSASPTTPRRRGTTIRAPAASTTSPGPRATRTISAGRSASAAPAAYVTDVRDRDYFKAIYFRVPSGILFEIATLSPGFAVDEDPEHIGEALRLPAQHEHLRDQLEATLRPVHNPRVLV